MTQAEFQNILEGCKFGNPNTVSDLISKRYTNVKFNEAVNERHLGRCEAYSYFTDFFPSEVWADGQGQDMITEEYYHPRINYSFEYFTRTMQVCDPEAANECVTHYCDIPEGGYGNLPGPEMYKWGFKSKPMCVANIRHLRQFEQWAKRIVDTRFSIDEQVMQMFYTFMAIRTTGHKLVLEGVDDGTGQLQPAPSADPRNPLGGFRYNYQDVQFPQLVNPDNLLPLDMNTLDMLSLRWDMFNMDGHVATGPRGEKIWEFWHPMDWFKQEFIDNPDYMEKMKHTMPQNLFAGFRNNGNGKEREVIGNWSMKTVPCLPRFAPDCNGGVRPVNVHTDVPVEIGFQAIESREWMNAPILMALSPSPRQGKILRRPDLTESAEGFPILPIMGSGDWIIHNHYDPECNEDLNQPHTRKRYEMGFMMTDPDAAIAFLFRAKKFRLRPTHNCDLQPMTRVEPVEVCPGRDLVKGSGHEIADASVTKQDFANKVLCQAALCINGEESPFEYRLQLERHGNRPDFNELDCPCGSTITLIVTDAEGAVIRTQPATVKFLMPHDLNPLHKMIIVTTDTLVDLDAGECVQGVVCDDGSPTIGNVTSQFVWSAELDCTEFDGARYVLDSPLSCEVGTDVTIEYLDADGVLIDPPGAITGTIAEANHGFFAYRVTSADPDAFTVPANATSTRLTCV